MKFIEGRTAERAEHPGQACLNRGGGERQLGGKMSPVLLVQQVCEPGSGRAGVLTSAECARCSSAPRSPPAIR